MAITPYRKVVNEGGRSGLGQLLQGIGTVAGGVIGGIGGAAAGGVGAVPGAMGGAAAGGALGSTLGGFVDPEKAPEVKEQETVQSAQQDNGAMSRRLAEMNNDPGVQIADANAAMAKMPPEIQQEYGPVLSQAQKLSMNRRV